MWPDDEWDDEPSSGSIPDQANRHWRHPSEIGALGPMAGETSLTPLPVPADSGSGWRWPAGALGGGLAFVALGAFGLGLADTTSQDVLTAGSIPALSSPATNTAQTLLQTTTTASSPLSGSAHTGAGSDTDSGTETARERLARSTTQEDDRRWAPLPGPSPVPSIPLASTSTIAVTTILTESIATNEVEAEQQLLDPAPGMWGPFGPAVFAGPYPDQLLGSFVAVEDYLLTSARALSGRSVVYLLIDQSWIPAEVVGADPLTDVAVLAVDPWVRELGMPSDIRVSEPIEANTTIFVGYCPKELLLSALEATTVAVSAPGCGPVKPVDVTQDPSPEVAEAAPGAAEDEPNRRASGGELTVEIKRRLGNVWSTSQTVDRILGHNVYDLIKTSVPKSEQMAGAALRNTVGEVVGLVVAAETPNVAALPIDRALSTAEVIMNNGSDSFGWLGIEPTSDSSGVWVKTVDELSPAAEFVLPGDRLITINGHPIRDPDHLIHLTRMSAAGEPIVLSITRGKQLMVFSLVVGEVPVTE